MGLPTYSCSESFAARIPDLFVNSQIECTRIPDDCAKLRYRFQQGWGTVEIACFEPTEASPGGFFLVCARNPLFWIWDLALHRRVAKILEQGGTRFENR